MTRRALVACAQVVLTTREGAKMEGNVLPVSYSKLGAMVQKGDTIFLGRYLVTGSEESSCFLTVRAGTSCESYPCSTDRPVHCLDQSPLAAAWKPWNHW
jgi:hypothetical protein